MKGGDTMESTKKKMGRPTENPKTRRLEIRLSDSEAKMLDDCAKKMGKSRTDVIMKGIAMVHEDLHK